MGASGLTVVKIGGSLLEHENFAGLIRQLSPALQPGRSLVVHGGGKEVSAWAERLGIPSRFRRGRRVTDGALMEVAQMVLCGKVNPDFVSLLVRRGLPAVGWNGRDRDLVVARRLPGLGRVGLPARVDAGRVRGALAQGDLPVFASIASDGRGGALNVNADEMAAGLASALKAERLILFTDVAGILDAEKRTLPRISARGGEALIAKGVITGGMIPKLRSAFAALRKGVREVWILQGKLPLSRSQGTCVRLSAGGGRHPFHR